MSLYSPSEQSSNVPNGSRNMTDGSGTINPAALSGGGVTIPKTNNDSTPRGTKRSRSPDDYGDYSQGDGNAEQAQPRKRGRPAKTPRTSGDYTQDQSGALPTPSSQVSPGLRATPQASTAPPVATPTQSSPGPRATPKATLKALPTVRDHTSDQLGPGGDEYIPREYDEQGEQKVSDTGYLQGGREYKMRTFTLPGRGDKLFMLATECARTLQYRDSYLLFNKNRSLFKIIATIKDKEELVSHDILPYSYRSRQIALVTARSMFRQFGSRVVKDGRRVRDDYWEAKARKQGFTEEDAAGEKRPGAARAREAAAAEALGQRQLAMYGPIVYAQDANYANIQPPPMPPGVASTMPQMTTMEAYNQRYQDVPRPRIENVGPAYNDVTRTSSEAEMSSQSSHAAEFSKQVNSQGRFRKSIVSDYWHRPHDPPVSTPQQTAAEPVTTQGLQSPGYDNADTSTVQSIPMPQPQASHTTMNPPSVPHQQNSSTSPGRQGSFGTPAHPSLPRNRSNLSQVETPGMSNYPYSPMSQQANWGQPPPQPQPSPSMNRSMYSQQHSSPHMPQHQLQSPVHSQSPHQQQHSQMQPPQNYHPQMSAAGMGGNPQLMMPGSGLAAMNAGTFNPMDMQQRQMYNQMARANYMPQQQQHPGGQPQQHGMYGWQGQQGYQ